MIIDCPCGNCDKKGCGVYHDQCEEYQKYVKFKSKVREDINKDNVYIRKKRGW